MAAPDDNPRESTEEPTQVLVEDDWPVSDLYRVESDEAPVESDPATDETVVVAAAPAEATSPVRRFPVDPVPGVLAAVLVVLLVIGLGAWLVNRDGSDGNQASAQSPSPTTTAPTETSTTTTPASSGRTVPDVSAMTLVEARTALEKDGYRVRVVRRVSDRPPDEILRQSPSAGAALEPNEVVTLTVARVAAEETPAAVEVPDVVGLAVSEATAALQEVGLRSAIELVASDEAAGAVLRQSPSAGAEAPAESVVELVVAKAGRPAVARVELPDVVGTNVADARARLRDAGLRVRVVRVVAQDPAGTVLGQSPRAGAEAREGSTVTLRVSTGPSEVTVPDVVGLDEASATLQLENAGFTVRVTDQSTDDPAEDGVVLLQTPSGGSTAREGAVVTITVARVD